jgi:hypothetical protein
MLTRPRLHTIFILALTLGLAGSCGQSTTQSSTERSEYEGTAERELGELGARIDSLKAEADTVGYEIQAQLEDLERKREIAREKFAQMKDAAGNRWQEMKREMSEALDDLGRSVDKMKPRRGT